MHRDIAARNILISRSKGGLDGIESVKLADFGRAKKLDQRGRFVSTEENELLMPFVWSAPESIKDFLWATNSEVWSTGCLMLEVSVCFKMESLSAESLSGH